jgi:hypothetical protein
MREATLLLAAVVIALPAGANTIMVNSTGYYHGDGGCSLTEAIKNANAGGAPQPECAAGAPGMDVIEFATELYDHEAVVLGVDNTNITEPVTIDGPGVYRLGVSGLVFYSGASGSFVEDVRLSGAATISMGADLTLNRVRVMRGVTFGSGGGIGVTNANLTVVDSEISGNMAYDPSNFYPHFGGGISFNGDGAGTRTLNSHQRDPQRQLRDHLGRCAGGENLRRRERGGEPHPCDPGGQSCRDLGRRDPPRAW